MPGAAGIESRPTVSHHMVKSAKSERYARIVFAALCSVQRLGDLGLQSAPRQRLYSTAKMS
jgi:hypothetical protein